MKSESNHCSLGIVLTGTIIPNTVIDLKHVDPESRRQEYIKAIHFYRSFAPVYFLENSSYDLSKDRDFQDIPNVTIHQFNASSPSKGKGFQEFEMLDGWVDIEPRLPKRWIKVTGRYLYPNFHRILDECIRSSSVQLIIDQYLFAKHSNTALFSIDTDFYVKNIYGLYSLCDDSQRLIIEKVLFKTLTQVPKKEFKRFSIDLRCEGIAGHTGREISNRWVDSLNSRIRDINYWFDRHYIWLSI
jgi:hypothetical protein